MCTRNVLLQVFLCLRVLVTRVSPQYLTPLWPLVVTELSRIFQSPSIDNMLTLSALKFVDLCLVLNVEGFHVFRWVFLSPLLGEQATLFQPLVVNCASLLLQQAEHEVESTPATPKNHNMRRPLLTMQSVNDSTQLGGCAQTLIRSADNQRLKAAPPDRGFVELLLELEFIEFRVDTTALALVGVDVKSQENEARPKLSQHKFGDAMNDDWHIVLDDNPESSSLIKKHA